jgi:hypothetical protein
MAGKLKSVRLSDATIGKFEDIKDHYNMTDSDLLRVMVLYAITHETELHAYIKRAAAFITYGSINDEDVFGGGKNEIK